MSFKIKLFCGNNHELTKYDSKHKSQNGCDRLHCLNCNEFQDKKANNVSKGVVFICDKCDYIVCMNCVIERFGTHFKLEE